MREPPGGVPDADISADTMFVARVPIYGTCDAGRGFWKKLRNDILGTGLKENAVLRALYICQEGGEPKAMVATHVNDMLWATKPGYEDRIQQLLDHYTLKTVESSTLRLCGRSVVQHPDFSISVRCKDTTEKIELVRNDPKGRKQTDLARDHEVAQLRSVVTPRCQRHSGGDTAEGTARCETTTKTHRVSFHHRLHRHLSALEDAKSTAVEAQTPRSNVAHVWTAGSWPLGVK